VGDGIASSFSGRIRNDRLRWQVSRGTKGFFAPILHRDSRMTKGRPLKNDQGKAAQE